MLLAAECPTMIVLSAAVYGGVSEVHMFAYAAVRLFALWLQCLGAYRIRRDLDMTICAAVVCNYVIAESTEFAFLTA